MNLKIISAGAGSGKTYRLTQEMVGLLASGEVRASGIIATTFTNKAAAELQERVRVKLLEEGLAKEANDLANALIGTVHGLGVKLLKRFAFEAGVSPEVDIIADEDQQFMFNQSLAMVLTNERVGEMGRLSDKLGLNKSVYNATDWRKLLRQLTEIARSNNFSGETLEKSKHLSFSTFCEFLDKKNDRPKAEWQSMLSDEIAGAISRLENNDDTTKTTATGVKALKELNTELNLRGELYWHQWVKLAKLKVGAKSREDMAPLVGFADSHLAHPGFHKDIQSFIFNLFEMAQSAIDEYSQYKLSRGLIDYTDMEVLVNQLLDSEVVKENLKEELDLLMVDEFQDTSPLQLEIFLKLSKLAKHAVWVGDPKQSIYGFRGAEPALMDAIIARQGGLKKENILEFSWRSREDIVYATNAVFTQAFGEMPVEQVALKAKRCKKAGADSANREDEPPEIGNALLHWHFEYDGEGRKPSKPWFNHCLAESVRVLLERGTAILPKGEKEYRKIQPGDIAILCRSNFNCQDMADALHQVGLKAAISRAGLLGTAEAKLVLACLKFILNQYDSLSVAEILLLASNTDIEDIVTKRIDFLDQLEGEGKPTRRWGDGDPIVERLNQLRQQVVELSSAEILNLLLEETDLRRIIASWGNVDQRLANIDVFTRLSYKYEEACNRLHTAASLGGFLLWLNDLENNQADMQGAGENPLAVNVLTYHKSKGLEFPVVLCHSLDQPLRDDVWGMNIVQEQEEVDLGNLLGNRWLRLWVNPYSDQFKNTKLAERIDGSGAKAEKRNQALAEEARLLYVGITRARDYLVFPTYHKPPVWLNRVFHKGIEDRAVLDHHTDLSPWEWNGGPLVVSTEVLHFGLDFTHSDAVEQDVFVLPPANRDGSFPVYRLDEMALEDTVKLSESVYGTAVCLPEVIERQLVGQAIASFLNAGRGTLDAAAQLEMAERAIHVYGVGSLVEGDRVLQVAAEFEGWIEREFKVVERYQNFPVRAHFDGQLFEATLDLLVKTGDGFAVILNSPYVGEAKARFKRAKETAGRLAGMKMAVQQVFDVVEVGLYVHFVLFGVVLKVYSESPDSLSV